MNFTQEKDPKKHLWGIGLVVALHAIVIWALLTGLAQKIVEVVKAPLETMIIQEIKPPPPPPPPPVNLPPPPKAMAPPPPFIPPPEVVVATPPPTETIQVTTAVVPQVVERMVPTAPPDPASTAPVNTPRAAEPVKEPARVAAERDKSSCEDPEYPPTSRRNEEQGTVILRFLVDVSGHVVDGKVATSSGSSRLDRAAKDAFSQCTFKPATVDGKPEQAWVSVRYLFQLN